MSTQLKKSLLIGLGIFAFIILTIGIVYFVRKPTTTTTITPPPAAIASVAPSPVETAIAAPIFVVDQISACTKTFTVACTVTHHECDTTTKACKVVDGAGADTCTTDANCVTPTHHACDTTTQTCKIVSGAGADTCTTDANCAETPSAALKCVAKRMYEDDSRNRTGFYYLEREITDASTLTDGQTILYNVTTKNSGGNGAPDTTITDVLSSNLTYVDGDSGCTYDTTTRTVTCIIGTLSPNSEAQRSFRAKVSVTGTASVANTAEVTSTNGQRDSCSVKVDATGKVVTVATPAPTALPVAGVFEITAGTIGVGFLFLLAGVLGLLLI